MLRSLSYEMWRMGVSGRRDKVARGRWRCARGSRRSAGQSPRTAFSLIELIVVIGVLVPSLRSARESAKRVVCATREKEMLNATNMYVTEWHRYPPSLANTVLPWYGWSRIDWLGAGHDGEDAHAAPESGLYFAYLKTADVYMCPSDRPAIVEAAAGIRTVRRFSYSMNGRVGLLISGRFGTTSEAKPSNRVPGDADLPVFFEEDPNGNLDARPEGCFTGSDRAFERHVRLTNVGFADGHVSQESYTSGTTARSLFDALGVPKAPMILGLDAG